MLSLPEAIAIVVPLPTAVLIAACVVGSQGPAPPRLRLIS
jgi:hypothetical protein